MATLLSKGNSPWPAWNKSPLMGTISIDEAGTHLRLQLPAFNNLRSNYSFPLTPEGLGQAVELLRKRLRQITTSKTITAEDEADVLASVLEKRR